MVLRECSTLYLYTVMLWLYIALPLETEQFFDTTGLFSFHQKVLLLFQTADKHVESFVLTILIFLDCSNSIPGYRHGLKLVSEGFARWKCRPIFFADGNTNTWSLRFFGDIP